MLMVRRALLCVAVFAVLPAVAGCSRPAPQVKPAQEPVAIHSGDPLPPPPPWNAPVQELPPLPPHQPLTREEEMRLKQALKEQHEKEGKTIALSGPATRGMTIQIAGKSVKLPPDAELGGLVTSVECGPGATCPEAPYYVIMRGGSRISVNPGTGKAFGKSIATGEEHAFDFLDGIIQEETPRR